VCGPERDLDVSDVRFFTAALTLEFVAAVVLCSCGPSAEEEYRKNVVLLRDGDFDAAATKAHKAWQGRPHSEWYWRFRLLEAESLMEGGKPDKAAALLTGSSGASTEFEIRRRVLSAHRAAGVSDFGHATVFLAEARQLAIQHSRVDLEPEIDARVAEVFARQHQLAQAEAAYQHARGSAETAAKPFLAASAVNNLGMLRLISYRCDEAIPLFDEAQKMWSIQGAHHWALIAANNLVICYNQLGDFDKAHSTREAILGLMRPGVLLARALGATGETFLWQQEPQKAIPYFRKAMDMARQFGASVDAARSAGNLTTGLSQIGDWKGAELALQEANELGPEPRSRPYLDLNKATIEQGRGLYADARSTCEQVLSSNSADAGARWMAYACLANSQAAEGNAALADDNFEAAIKVIESNQAELNSRENKITFLANLIQFYQDYVDTLITRNEAPKALAVADASRSRVLSQRTGNKMSDASPRQNIDFKAIALRSGSVWMSYWLAPRRSFLWVTTANETRAFVLPSAGEITKLVEEYRGFVETSVRDPLTVQNEAGSRLYEILIAPAAPMLPANARVIVVPDGALHQLSFETIPVYNGEKARYWMDDVTVAIAPSFGVFRGSEKMAASQKALIIGNPVSPGPTFPVLPHAAEEIANVSKRLPRPGQRIVTGDSARPEGWLTNKPGDFDIIHIAAHAESNSRSPLDSAIILSPGNGFRLYARDIVNVPLKADLVVLSACRSSGARSYAGEGLVGLTWAFLQAGAHNVVAGLWDVSDESTSILMDRFYAGIAGGRSPADALQNARLDLRKTQYTKPYYWGAFQCYLR
jgi:CHAT domain-containing protein